MRKVLVIPYYGTLPNYVQLWFDSCGKNPDFMWVLLTDCQLYTYRIPENVMCIKSNLSEIKKIFEKNIGEGISLERNYKLCDFKPLYWMILDHYKIAYDFWGYCDMDMLYGKLSCFLREELFEQYDRLYADGHLSLMSNSLFSKYAFLLDGAEVKWNRVFFEDKTYGFDEQHGVNRIWKKQKLLFYQNNTDILDIDPQFKSFRLTNIPLNKKKQIFFIKEGKVMQGYWKHKKLNMKEYAYIHIQKRKMTIDGHISNYLLVNNHEFKFVESLPENYEEYQQLFPFEEKRNAIYYINMLKTFVRFYRSKVFLKRLFV
jgi:hypothetical protein